MATEWIKATDELIDIAKELIDQYHPPSPRFLYRISVQRGSAHQ